MKNETAAFFFFFLFSAAGYHREIFSNNLLGCHRGEINYTWITNHTSDGRVFAHGTVDVLYEVQECVYSTLTPPAALRIFLQQEVNNIHKEWR